MTVIINNYNYGKYLSASITSVLAQTYPRCELVVVDDGSTDSSRDVIACHRSELSVAPVLKANGGQASAMNEGFRRSTGDIVLFLDSDDVLYPDAIATIVSLLEGEGLEQIAKVQWRLDVIGARGESLGRTVPEAGRSFPEPDVASGPAYGLEDYSPPTSGNAFTRRALELILPIPEEDYRICADAYLNAVCPVFGGVVSVGRSLGAYRIHGENGFSGRPLDLTALRRRILLERVRERDFRRFSPTEPDRLFNLADRVFRLISLRTEPASHPVSDDTVGQILDEVLYHLWVDRSTAPRRTVTKRVSVCAWFAAAAFLPSPLTTVLFEAVMSGSGGWDLISARVLVRLAELTRRSPAR